MRILSGIYILKYLFTIDTAESYSLEDFDNTYSQRDASIFYIRQLLKRIRSNHNDNLRWRKRTDTTLKKCKEIRTDSYFSGDTGPSIDNLATYQDCMSQCDASATCMAWSYQATTKTCQLLHVTNFPLTDTDYKSGSCIKKQVSYPPISMDTYRQQALDEHNFYRKKHCVPSLIINPALNDIAQSYAKHLADTHSFGHSGNKFNGQWMEENLYAKSDGILLNDNGTSPVHDWYSKIQDCNWSDITAAGDEHFT
ncbi:unnamed protein product [Adineta steineri]|uniref:Apple domain-containing protein n=1 Tax=Adineta steineri TaxID=433720 RepID=A0A815UW02_9BILA|nr:unnamed protein product [Adineta steineri]